MINENAQKLVAALRSGEFHQTRGRLRDDNGHCCLGVACEVYLRETGDGEWGKPRDATGLRYFYLDGHPDAAMLPVAVTDWLGFDNTTGAYDGPGVSLMSLNDAQAPFETIADVIESEPEGLFQKEGE